jgi:ketosteroid isomerase-like protein
MPRPARATLTQATRNVGVWRDDGGLDRGRGRFAAHRCRAGRAAHRDAVDRGHRFDEYDGPIGLETHDLNIAMSGDIAFAHMLHLDRGTRKNGIDDPVWVRSTVCCQRSNGKWLITHEHISMPGTWPVPGPEGNPAD